MTLFGKDPIGNIPTFGAQQFISAGQRPQSGGGSRKEFHWVGVYKLPQSPEQSDIGRFIPGKYFQQWLDDKGNLQEGELPFVMCKEHHNGQASCLCSAGPYFNVREKRLPCPSCNVFWEDWAIRNMKKANNDRSPGPERISVRDYFAFNWFDYGMHYQVPKMRKNGQPVMSKKTGQPITEWVKGAPNDPRFHGYAFKWGHLLPWMVSGAFKKELDNLTKVVSNGCVSCGGRESIVTITRNCAKCGAVFYDVNTTLTPEQRVKIDYETVHCPQCGHEGFTTEQIQCRNCGNPKRASIFDVDIEVRRSTSAKGVPHIKNVSDPRPLQTTQEIAAQVQPLDLLKKFAPTPPEEQNRLMGIGAMQQHMAQPGYLGMQTYAQQAPGLPPGVMQPPMYAQAPMQPPPGMAWQPQMQPQMQMQPMQMQQTPVGLSMPWQPAMSMSQQPQPMAPFPVAAVPQAQQPPPAVPYSTDDEDGDEDE